MVLSDQVGPVFWVQDRVEEVLYWRKPKWTWAWIMIWTFICTVFPSLRTKVLMMPDSVQTSTTSSPSLPNLGPSPPSCSRADEPAPFASRRIDAPNNDGYDENGY